MRFGDPRHISRRSQLAASCPAPAADAGASIRAVPAAQPGAAPPVLPPVQAQRSPRVPWAGRGHVQGDSRGPAPSTSPSSTPSTAHGWSWPWHSAGSWLLGLSTWQTPARGSCTHPAERWPQGSAGSLGSHGQGRACLPQPHTCLLSPRAPLLLLCPMPTPKCPAPRGAWGDLGDPVQPLPAPWHSWDRAVALLDLLTGQKGIGMRHVGAAARAAEVLLAAWGREQDPSHPLLQQAPGCSQLPRRFS